MFSLGKRRRNRLSGDRTSPESFFQAFFLCFHYNAKADRIGVFYIVLAALNWKERYYKLYNIKFKLRRISGYGGNIS